MQLANEVGAPAGRATRFPVVGIGASAGGLDAFRQCLGALPASTGMAYLLVQHLDPNHPSALAELLAPYVKMPVVEGSHDVLVAVDVVYVIPSGVNMTLVDGRLRMSNRESPNLPVDALFESMAEDLPGACIGVVLSGNGADGTQGLEAIKASGGTTFTQDASAEYGAMPSSARSSGCADNVLSAAEIGVALAGLHVDTLVSAADDVAAAALAERSDLATLIALLHARHAVDFGSYRASALERRIHRRMLLRNIRSYGEYGSLLAADEDEVDALYDDILINVTSFFRDASVFAALKQTVFPLIFRDRPAHVPVRVWVPGCSTGQEVYSLIIAMTEYLDGQVNRPPIQVFGTDLSERVALRRARVGAYPSSIAAEVSPERLARFFTREGEEYRVNKELRDSVVFARHDLTTDPPFSRLDMVSCRNVLIYLSAPLQRRVVSTLHYALATGGFLVLGSAETVGTSLELFAVVDQRSRIYAKRSSGQRTRTTARPSGAFVSRSPSAPTDWRAAADRVALDDLCPPSVLVNDSLDVIEFRGETSRFLSPPVGHPSFNLQQLARGGLYLELRSALLECRRSGEPVERANRSSAPDAPPFDLRVLPVHAPGTKECCYLILFRPRARPDTSLRRMGSALRWRRWVPEWLWSALRGPMAAGEHDPERLRKELVSTREYYQSVNARSDAANEILSSANEEIVSGNEELQSTNEELETAKEELQSVNEELLTVNEQLHGRNLDLVRLTDDLTNLLGSAGVPMIALDGGLHIRRFTPAAGDVLQLREADLGRGLGSLNLPIPSGDLEQLCHSAVASEQVAEQEVRTQTGRWYALRIHPYRTTDGTVDGAVLVLADIHDAKRAEELIRDSRDYVSAIVETVRDPLLVLDASLRIESANHAFYDRFGAAAAVGKLLGEIGVEWFEATLQGRLRQVLFGDGMLVDHEVNVGADGRTHTWLLNARRMVGGGAQRVLLAVEDVTEPRRISEELRAKASELAAADRRKSEFLAILAHELRNPLTPVRNALQVQRLTSGDPVRAEQTLVMMERQVRHMTRLVDDLLDVSRVGLGRIRLQKRRVDLAAVVTQTVTLERQVAELSGHQLVVDVPPTPVVIDGDPVRIDQIVGNLLANAIKYTDPGGRIALTVSVHTGSAVLEVSDTGVGISAAMLPGVWELFTQAEWSADRARGGLGIGLALVKSLTLLHGGTVEGHSAGVGQGSRFVVRLPLAAGGLLDDTPSGFHGAASLGPSRRILVVDDDPDVVASLRMLLEVMGHEVATAMDGPTAMSAAAELLPEFVFLDIGLKGISGHDLARRFRADPRFKSVMLVALTGYGTSEDRQRSLEAGFDVHLVKPVEPDEIDRLLRARSG